MVYDFKKAFKQFYQPKEQPEIITIPEMRFISVSGQGNPNTDGGTYSEAVALLYALSYAIKMSYKKAYAIDGYFPYVVPPLEGLWWMSDGGTMDYANKEKFLWISMIRQPDFVCAETFAWACAEVAQKKGLDTSLAQLFCYEEGLSVQCMHIGSYDEEPATIARMETLAQELGYKLDMDGPRKHHEIYLNDPRKTPVDKRKTIIRHPLR